MIRKHTTPSQYTLAIIYHNLAIGGIQKKIVDIVNKTTELYNWNIHLVLLENHANPLQKKIKKKSSIRFIYKNLYMQRIFYASRNYRQLYFLIIWMLFNNPDTILVFQPSIAINVVFLRTVLFWKKSRIIIGEDEHYTHYASYNKTLMRLLYPLAEQIVVPTKSIKEELQTYFRIAATKIKVIHNWFYDTRKISYTRTTKKYDILFLSRLDSDKNPSDMMILAKELNQNHAYTICVVGSGSQERIFFSEGIKNKFHLLYRGLHTETKQFYEKSKIFVSFSKNEGMPLTFIEAMYYGCIVIAIKYPGIDEIIDHGKNGFICHSLAEMQTYIHMMLSNEKKRNVMAAYAKKDVSNRFGIMNLDSYLALLDIYH